MGLDDVVDGIRLNGGMSWERRPLDASLTGRAAETLDTPRSSWIHQSEWGATPGAQTEFWLEMDRRALPGNASHTSETSPSVAEFVEHRFIPEHVAAKRPAGRAHFYAILKHVLSPEEVSRIIGRTANDAKSRLTPIPAWPYIGGLPLREVDPPAIQRLISAALRRGYSIQTVTHIRNVVRSIFTHAARTGNHLGTNPASLATLPAMSRKEVHTLSLSQVGYLLHSMGWPERELALFTMLAEMSVAEICGLQWKYLNLSNTSQKLDYEVIPPLMIAVRKQLYRGELTAAVGSRRRFVRVTPPLCSLLRELKNRERFTLPLDFVFVSRKGTTIHPENVAARRLKSLGKSFNMAWLSWPVFHRTGIKLRRELGRAFDVEFERIVTALRSAPS